MQKFIRQLKQPVFFLREVNKERQGRLSLGHRKGVAIAAAPFSGEFSTDPWIFEWSVKHQEYNSHGIA